MASCDTRCDSLGGKATSQGMGPWSGLGQPWHSWSSLPLRKKLQFPVKAIRICLEWICAESSQNDKAVRTSRSAAGPLVLHARCSPASCWLGEGSEQAGVLRGAQRGSNTERLAASGQFQPFENVFYQRPRAIQLLPVTTKCIWFEFSNLSPQSLP